MKKMLFDSSLLKKKDLEIDLRKLGEKILNELFFSSHCLALYTPKGLTEVEVSKKAFNWLKKLFRLRSFFDFHLYQGRLYAMGIPLEEEIFIRNLKSELSKFSLGSVYIYSQVTPEELLIFLKRLSEKHLSSFRKLNLQRFLEEKKIRYIRVKGFEQEDPFIEDSLDFFEKCEDFKVRTLARSALQEDSNLLRSIMLKDIKKDIDLEGRVKFDFRLRVFQSVIHEELAKLPEENIKGFLADEFGRGILKILYQEKKHMECVIK